MATRIGWSPQALRDLKEIGAYIRKGNPRVAKAFVRALTEKVEALKKFPQLGRVVPEEDNSLVREIILRPYRIVYRYIPATDAIEVSRVWHAARGEPDLGMRS
jgi:toxin ParE1/3/4